MKLRPGDRQQPSIYETFMTTESLFYKKVETGLKALIENELLEIVFDEYSHYPSIKFGESSTK
jgi:hypothetical protein